jgi:hypothetical protein
MLLQTKQNGEKLTSSNALASPMYDWQKKKSNQIFINQKKGTNVKTS